MVLFTLLTSLVFAQSTNESKDIVHKLDFENMELTATVKKPHGEMIVERLKGQFNPLVTLRADFQPEMFESINEIK